MVFSCGGQTSVAYHLAGTSSLETKSLASSDTFSKASESKSQFACRMLFMVSASLSPKNGDRPLKLQHNSKTASALCVKANAERK